LIYCAIYVILISERGSKPGGNKIPATETETAPVVPKSESGQVGGNRKRTGTDTTPIDPHITKEENK